MSCSRSSRKQQVFCQDCCCGGSSWLYPQCWPVDSGCELPVILFDACLIALGQPCNARGLRGFFFCFLRAASVLGSELSLRRIGFDARWESGASCVECCSALCLSKTLGHGHVRSHTHTLKVEGLQERLLVSGCKCWCISGSWQAASTIQHRYKSAEMRLKAGQMGV